LILFPPDKKYFPARNQKPNKLTAVPIFSKKDVILFLLTIINDDAGDKPPNCKRRGISYAGSPSKYKCSKFLSALHRRASLREFHSALPQLRPGHVFAIITGYPFGALNLAAVSNSPLCYSLIILLIFAGYSQFLILLLEQITRFHYPQTG